ncbi:MAG: Lrp/AsnC family transcriptional regulator [Chloroflexi bacterium]|nr:Lrp/AsnC family transcriptional regulator [Chloroflexota bacterium]MCH8195396.1 Lrp/AsnC family transcriptional regulator [Chloroflexota bacterium]MCH8284370.1 Lrp/AsnC family transcriptional regulator [Chloroflexota bacterium]MCI0769348.1 Lrp/AsnC family transcriptional regulator [Chloroflexota bacterium]
MKIDQTDRAIISLLQDDARQSNAAIARVIGVSEATIRRRIKIMVEDGVVAIQAVLNPTKFGLSTSAMIGIDVQPDHLDTVAEALNDRKEVGFLGVCTGRYDLLVWALVESLDQLREFLEGFLAKVPGVRKTETLVLLDVKKRSLGRIS